MSPERRYYKQTSRAYVLVKCRRCGAEQWVSLYRLEQMRTNGCEYCSQAEIEIPNWLDRRLTAAKQRCTNPKDKGYPNYGGRGIKFEWETPGQACQYIIRNFGIPDRSLELDRIDTNGNYAPGNIRFITREQNQANRRNTVLPVYDPCCWPYAASVVRMKLSDGETRERIIEDAWEAVRQKRKNWRGIKERLESMTYEMPEDFIATRYRTA